MLPLSYLDGSLCQKCQHLDYYDTFLCGSSKPMDLEESLIKQKITECKFFEPRKPQPNCEYDGECVFWCQYCQAWENRMKNFVNKVHP